MKYERQTRFTWTNWTFGVWWDRTKLHAVGLDLGPLEIIWREPKSAMRARVRDELANRRKKLGGRFADPLQNMEVSPRPTSSARAAEKRSGPFPYDSGPVQRRQEDMTVRRDALAEYRDRLKQNMGRITARDPEDLF